MSAKAPVLAILLTYAMSMTGASPARAHALAGASAFEAASVQADGSDFEPWRGPGETAISARLGELARECRAEMNQTLNYDPQDVIVAADFNLDGVVDPVLDQSKVYCGESLALWAGTGGSPVRIFVSDGDGGWDEHTTGGFAGRVELIGHVPVWLSLVHGTACDGYGALPCAQVLIWGDGAFRSVADGKRAEP
ncbi:hypothetical protein L2D01_04150 [Hyphomonadaceae bacterium ML37]|nr:hypothetical protein L2D01_04150 [Hyphomonadaceae bacterium ML37]